MTATSTVRHTPAVVARHLWWRVVDYAAVLRWQAMSLLDGPGPDAYASPEHAVGPPVVLVPGVYETWRFMRPLAALMHSRGVRVHVVPGLGWNVTTVAEGAEVLGRALADADVRGAVLVAHSKGGLIGKLSMARHDPDGRIASMVAVNTPFAGSVLARWMPGRTLRAFTPTDATIVALAAEADVNARIVAAHSFWDPHIPGSGALPGARDVVLATPGHFRPLADPVLLDVLLDHLGVPDTRPAGRRLPGSQPAPRREQR